MKASEGAGPVAGSAGRILDPLPVTVPRPLVLLRLGYRRPDQVPAKTRTLLDEVQEQVQGMLAPRAVWDAFPVSEPGPGEIAIGDTVRSAGRSLFERLAGCRRAVLFAATIGPGVEAWQADLMAAGEMTRGLLADACASSAAIALGMEMERVVTRWLKAEGLEATRRHAPGYGDWGLEAQAPLLRLLDAERIGITLTEDFLMVPAKTISGVIGGR